MKKEYLPIGSICTLNKNNLKVMIIGYLSVDYSANIKMFTYSAVPYPSGTTGNSTRYSFNDEDIKNIDFVGFKDDSYNKLNEQLLKVKPSELINEVDQNEELQKALKFQFDENGFVISEDNRVNIDNTPVNNPFNDYGKLAETTKDSTIKTNDWPIFSGYRFDENGTVVEETKPNQSQHNSNYKFDDAGVVVGTEVLQTETTSPFQFDENGTVTSVNVPTTNEVMKETNNIYRFDEGGIVVDVHDKKSEKQGYVFDENGFVVKADK
ncbi:MAG: DUF4176 domain-containing protein [Ignavibacteriales bacterium]